MLSKQQILNGIEKNKDILRRFDGKRIGLFGSYLHGTANQTSDIDLVKISGSGIQRLKPQVIPLPRAARQKSKRRV